MYVIGRCWSSSEENADKSAEHHYPSLLHHVHLVSAARHRSLPQDRPANLFVDDHAGLGSCYDRVRVRAELETVDRPADHSWYLRSLLPKESALYKHLC